MHAFERRTKAYLCLAVEVEKWNNIVAFHSWSLRREILHCFPVDARCSTCVGVAFVSIRFDFVGIDRNESSTYFIFLNKKNYFFPRCHNQLLTLFASGVQSAELSSSLSRTSSLSSEVHSIQPQRRTLEKTLSDSQMCTTVICGIWTVAWRGDWRRRRTTGRRNVGVRPASKESRFASLLGFLQRRFFFLYKRCLPSLSHRAKWYALMIHIHSS